MLLVSQLPTYYSVKKEGRQLDFASCPPAATIFSFIYGVVKKISVVGGPLG